MPQLQNFKIRFKNQNTIDYATLLFSPRFKKITQTHCRI